MTRVKRGIATKKRHKRLLKSASGFWGQRKNIIRRAKETLLRAWAYAFKGRRLKKRDMRGLFIARIKAASNDNGVSYNSFISNLKKSNVNLNRKMLSQIAIFDPSTFKQLIDIVCK